MLSKILKLSLGNLSGPLIVLICTPIITRIYTPEDLGDYFYNLTIAMFLSVVVGLQLFNKIITTVSYYSADVSLYSNIYINIIVSNLILIVYLIVYYSGEAVFDIVDAIYIYVATVLIALNQVFLVYYSRLNYVNLLVTCVLLRTLSVTFISVILGIIFDDKENLLIISYVLAELIVLLYHFYKLNFKRKYAKFAAFKILDLVLEGKNFIKYSLPTQLWTNLCNSAVVIIIKYENIALAGFYSMIYRLIGTPVYSVGGAVKSLFYIELNNRKTHKLSALLIYILLICIVTILLAFTYYQFELEIFSYILGSKWVDIDEFIPYFVAWFGFSLANMLPSEILKHSNMQHKIFYWECLAGFFKLTSLYFYYSLNVITLKLLVYVPSCYFIITMVGTLYLTYEASKEVNK